MQSFAMQLCEFQTRKPVLALSKPEKPVLGKGAGFGNPNWDIAACCSGRMVEAAALLSRDLGLKPGCVIASGVYVGGKLKSVWSH